MDSFHTDQVFSTREILMEWVQNVARSLGYVVNIKRSKTKASGYVSKIILVCDRSGVYKGTSSRDTGTKKINCPFELVANYYKTYDYWTLTVKNGEHNHDPATYMEGHSIAKRVDLHQELLAHFEDYKRVYEDDIYGIIQALNFYESPAVRQYWMIMPDTGFLIANKYGVIVHFLSKQGSSTCFRLWSGPHDFPNHRAIVISIVYGSHYVKVDLQDGHPMPVILPLWRIHRSPHSAGWKILYNARLNAYIPPNSSRNNCNVDRVELSDN